MYYIYRQHNVNRKYSILKTYVLSIKKTTKYFIRFIKPPIHYTKVMDQLRNISSIHCST